ncbi:MAG TPA: PAS domain-containing protein, partial [Burkholderiaceae bacterium]
MRSGRPQETGTAHAAAGRRAGAGGAREHELDALRAALERSERRAHEYLHWLRIASDDGKVGLWQRDLATGAVSMDACARAIVGWPPDGEPPTAEQYHELVLPEDRARFALSRGTFPAPGATDEVEYRLRRPDGDIRRVVTRRSVHYGADGAPQVMFGALIDVTERWRTEHALREANQRLQLAADSAGLGLWDWDLGTGTLRIDGRVRQMLGVGEDWLPTPENWVARIHPEDRALTRQAYDEAFVPGRRHAVVEYRVLLPDRGVRHVFETISMEPGPDGWPRRVFGATLDVSEMQQARQELGALAERLQLATATARIGIWEWRAPGPIEVWDARMREIYGIRDPGFSPSREQWMARVHPNDRARVLASCSAHMRRGGAGELEYRIVRSDGEVRLIDDRMIVMRDEHGEVTRMLGTQLDITELRLAEDALRAKEAAERANRAKTEFLSRMSHELRTPLNAVLGFTQVLALDRAHPLAPAQAERVSQIQTAGWHLLELINEILELSCIEAGSIRLARAVVSLAPLVDECLELLAAQVAAR